MSYSKGSDAANLRTRFKKKLVQADLVKKDKFTGFRWLAPEENSLLVRGEIKKGQGAKQAPLFSVVGELLPRESWHELPDIISGVYILFDAAEVARYVGISNNVRTRLGQYFAGNKADDLEKREVVTSFSVFGVTNRARARELESLLIHAMGPQLILNKQKHRHFSEKPNPSVFEPGTLVLRRSQKYVGVQSFANSLTDRTLGS